MPVQERSAVQPVTPVRDPGGLGLDSRADGELTAAEAWSLRVRRVGGLIQLAFAALWLVRGAW